MTSRLSHGLVVLTAALVALGACAEPEQIDRVQPDLMEKSMFTGEWYILDTAVRSPYASHYMFQGLQGTMERGVWQFEKNYLYFYRTYEFVEGVESQGIKSDTDAPLLDENGDPVTYEKTLDNGETVTVTRYIYRSSALARYPIIGHYDVRKSYNTSTGQETNVTIEDAGEKYWYERAYARVDFGKDYAFHNGRLSSPLGQYQGEEGDADVAIRIADDNQYFDFVTQHFFVAPRTYLRGWGYIPTCLFYPWFTGSYYECDTEEIHVRTSFMRVEENNTYESFDYNDGVLNKFGFYRSARAQYDEFYGITYPDAIRPLRRFRIWEEYLDTDGDGELNYEAMTPRPVVYYLSEDFPRELVPGSLDLADEWDVPFRAVVETHLGEAYDGRMFVLCENNLHEVAKILEENPNAVLAETDERYCKDMDQPKLLGDLRYNNLVSVNDPTQYGLYGYGPMNSDPITGETVHANAFNYTGNIRLGARTATDMIEYAAGVQNYRDVAQAQHISDNIKAKALHNSQGSPTITSVADAQMHAGRVMAPTVAAALTDGGLQQTDVDLAIAGMAPLMDADELKWIWMNDEAAMMAGMPPTELNMELDDDTLERIVHPAHLGSEDMMLFNHKKDMAHGQHAICMGQHFDASFRGFSLAYKTRYDNEVCDGLIGRDDLIFDFSVFGEPGAACDTDANVCGEREVCMAVTQGGGADGKYCVEQCSAGALLDQLRQSIRQVNQWDEFAYWDPNALYTDAKDERVTASQEAAREIVERVREEVFVEVFDRMWSTIAMHEVGHNVGLRHNFASSTDALNYFPGYWDLKGTEDSNGDWQATSVWMGETDDQVRAGIGEYQQTSIMEYSSSFNARFQGLGSYDHAAILYGYGKLLYAFENGPDISALQDYIDEPDSDQPDNFGLNTRREHPLAFALRKVHHTNYPAVFGGVDNITNRKIVKEDELIATATWTVSPDQLCAEQGGKVFEARYCEAILDAEACTDSCPAGKSCQNGLCFSDDPVDATCCNFQDEHYTGLEVLNTDLEGSHGIVYFGEFQWMSESEERTGHQPCSMYDDPYDSSVCGQANSYCRPFADGYYCSNPDVVEVPFRFCSDEYNWTSPTCQTHDEGTDSWDMVRMRIDDYEAYWPFRAYKRDNDLFSPLFGYYGYVAYHFSWLRKHFEHWAYDYSRYNRDNWWENKFGIPWHQDINGGLSATLASQHIFDHMANVFARPSDSWYGYNVQRERYEPVIDNGANQYTHQFQVREDQGARPIFPSYSYAGYTPTPSRAGAYFDRLAALQYMTFPRMLFVRGADTFYDLKRFRFNMATVWPVRMQNLLSGVLSSNHNSYGWCIEHDGVPPTEGGNGQPTGVKPRMWFGSAEQLDDWYSNCTPLVPEPEYTFPTTQFRIPALMAIYGYGWMSQTYDRTFLDRTRLWLEGEGNDVTVPDGFASVTYTDTHSGKTYTAVYDPAEYDPSAPVDPRQVVPSNDGGFHAHALWPAAEMIARANALAEVQAQDDYENYEYSELQYLVARLEILRNLYAYFEY